MARAPTMTSSGGTLRLCALVLAFILGGFSAISIGSLSNRNNTGNLRMAQVECIEKEQKSENEQQSQPQENDDNNDGYLSVPQVCVESSRCKTLSMNKMMSFVHISKTGGASWIKELIKIMHDNVFPQLQNGLEFSVSHQSQLVPGFDMLAMHGTSLRSPRHHAWSLFTECKYDLWGQEKTNGTDFPHSGSSAEDDLRDFRVWTSHFLDETSRSTPIKTHAYNCYQASNFQSNFLASTANRPQLVFMQPTSEKLEKSLEVYRAMDFVALTEFFHESKCLLYYRLEPKTQEMNDYLTATCHCQTEKESLQGTRRTQNNGAQQQQQHADAHVTHHKNGHRSSMLDLDADLLQAIHALTRVDQELYKYSLEWFFAEIVWLERQLGHRVVCDKSLAKWEPELAYLNVSVSSMYQKEKSDHGGGAIATSF